MNTILSLSKVKFAMYGSSVFQNFCLGRQQVYNYIMTKRINVIKPFIYKKILLDFTLKYYYFSNIYPSKPRLLIYIQDNCKNFEHLSPNNKLIWLLSSEDNFFSRLGHYMYHFP
jgi:hypothetical protein